MCIGCHGIPGYQSSFPEVHKVPMISGQSGKYMASALQAYKKGERKHPTMRGVWPISLTEQDIADRVGLLRTTRQERHRAARQAQARTQRASGRAAEKGACVSCHGDNFAKPIDPSYPKIAGQHADYLFVALKSYKETGKNAYVGRSNGVMAGVVGQFSNDELKALAQYIGKVQGDLQVVPQPRFR
jgi:cytochrome c553